MKITTPLVFLLVSLFSLTLKSTDFQHRHFGRQNDTYYRFCAPIQFTRQGMHYFLQTIFNDPQYVHDFLPYSMTHLIQFLEHGKATEQNSVYMEQALRLFGNKLKSTSYISE